MTQFPYIPETAPFTPEQRAWLNGFLAGLLAGGTAPQSPTPPVNDAPNRPAIPLVVLYGSQTGSAEALARMAAKESEKRGFLPRVMELNQYEQADLARCGRAIIISSTWGDGDPPDNAANFWSWLKSDTAPRLDSLEFAVLGLGDRNYADFCGASKRFDARLEALGARRIVSRGECDVDYEAPSKAWLNALWEKLQSPAPANGAPDSNGHASSNGEVRGFGRKNPFPARLLRNVLLNKAGSGKEVRHYELSLEGSGLTYEAGDALGIFPENCPELVARLVDQLGFNGEETVGVDGNSLTLRDALIRHYDITRPSNELLTAVGKAAPESELGRLLAPEMAVDLKVWLCGRDVLDVVKFLASPLALENFIPLLRKLAPRLYSISSSPKAHPDQVHLTVSTVRYESFGRRRKGVASAFLADRAGAVKVYVHHSPGFKPPADGDAPMIMVGPGTGIAPFRAFLEEREAAGARARNWLFFGDQRRDTDFLYEEQLTRWAAGGLLSRLDLAFSRDQAGKIYVQDRMLENAAEIWSWLEGGAHFYVCGDATRMARDVDAALHQIIETAGRKNATEAKAYVTGLVSEKRYQRDVY